jgi:hypothetical protein
MRVQPRGMYREQRSMRVQPRGMRVPDRETSFEPMERLDGRKKAFMFVAEF